jgi:hypothetical protein
MLCNIVQTQIMFSESCFPRGSPIHIRCAVRQHSLVWHGRRVEERTLFGERGGEKQPTPPALTGGTSILVSGAGVGCWLLMRHALVV